MFQRPAFKDGITMFKKNTTKSDVEKKKLIPKIKLKTQDNLVRPAFITPQPVPRSVPSFEQLEKLNLQKEGLKVQLGPGTLSKMLGVEIQDVNNPNTKIKKNISIGELLTTQQGRLAGIERLLDIISRQQTLGGTPRYIEGPAEDITSIDQQENVALMAVFGMKVIENYVLTGNPINDQTLKALSKGIVSMRLPSRPSEMGLSGYLTDQNIASSEGYKSIAFLLKPTNDPNLSPEYPIYDMDGYTPIAFNEINNILQAGYVIDLNRRLVVQNIRGEEEEEKKADFGDIRDELKRLRLTELKDLLRKFSMEEYLDSRKDEIISALIQNVAEDDLDDAIYGQSRSDKRKYMSSYINQQQQQPPIYSRFDSDFINRAENIRQQRQQQFMSRAQRAYRQRRAENRGLGLYAQAQQNDEQQQDYGDFYDDEEEDIDDDDDEDVQWIS